MGVAELWLVELVAAALQDSTSSLQGSRVPRFLTDLSSRSPAIAVFSGSLRTILRRREWSGGTVHAHAHAHPSPKSRVRLRPLDPRVGSGGGQPLELVAFWSAARCASSGPTASTSPRRAGHTLALTRAHLDVLQPRTSPAHCYATHASDPLFSPQQRRRVTPRLHATVLPHIQAHTETDDHVNRGFRDVHSLILSLPGLVLRPGSFVQYTVTLDLSSIQYTVEPFSRWHGVPMRPLVLCRAFSFFLRWM